MNSKAYIDPAKCDRSPMCPAIKACFYVKAISQEKLGFLTRGVSVVDPEKCIGCGVCIQKCPHGAISLKA